MTFLDAFHKIFCQKLIGVSFTSCFSHLPLLIKMACNEQYPNNNKGNGDDHNNAETHPNRMVHVVVMCIYNWAKLKAHKGEDDAANQFPFPGH